MIWGGFTTPSPCFLESNPNKAAIEVVLAPCIPPSWSSWNSCSERVVFLEEMMREASSKSRWWQLKYFWFWVPKHRTSQGMTGALLYGSIQKWWEKQKLGGGFKHFLFSPLLLGVSWSNLTSIFFKWVETTNQKLFFSQLVFLVNCMTYQKADLFQKKKVDFGPPSLNQKREWAPKTIGNKDSRARKATIPFEIWTAFRCLKAVCSPEARSTLKNFSWQHATMAGRCLTRISSYN